jgi:hypothetical protein
VRRVRIEFARQLDVLRGNESHDTHATSARTGVSSATHARHHSSSGGDEAAAARYRAELRALQSTFRRAWAHCAAAAPEMRAHTRLLPILEQFIRHPLAETVRCGAV